MNGNKIKRRSALKPITWVTDLRVIAVFFSLITSFTAVQLNHRLNITEKENTALINNLEEMGKIVAQLKSDRRATRTINVLNEIPTQGKNLIPGWMVRVFQTETKYRLEDPEKDMGVFVIDEAKFSMNHHEYHGIPSPDEPTYLMNGYFYAERTGRYQFAIDIDYELKDPSARLQCGLTMSINQQNVIPFKTVKFNKKDFHSIHVVDGSELKAGVHPVQALIACKVTQPVSGEPIKRSDIKISFGVRTPGKERIDYTSNLFMHAVKSGSKMNHSLRLVQR